jgi:hypothetical protein
MTTIQILRGTRARLDAAAARRELLEGAPLLITDEDRLAIATSSSAYVAAAKQSEAGTSTWGGISGTLSNQTDLQAALNAKVSAGAGEFIPSFLMMGA